MKAKIIYYSISRPLTVKQELEKHPLCRHSVFMVKRSVIPIGPADNQFYTSTVC